MITFIVSEKRDGTLISRGPQEYVAVPRIGEHITIKDADDDEHNPQLYKVIAIVFGHKGPTIYAGDLIVERVATYNEFMGAF